MVSHNWAIQLRSSLAERGGLAYSEFERGRFNSVAHIALGLRTLQKVSETRIGEDGAIQE